MSYEVVRKMTCDAGNGDITITSGSSNVLPHIYRPRKWAEGLDAARFEEELRRIARFLYEGEMHFTPGCPSHAHEAFLKAMDEVRSKYPGEDAWGSSKSGEMLSLCQDEFVRLMGEPRDRSLYVLLTEGGEPCDVSYTSRGCHVRSLSYRVRGGDDAQRVGYIKMRAVTDAELPGVRFTARRVA